MEGIKYISNNALSHFVSLIYAYKNSLNGKIIEFLVTSTEVKNFLFLGFNFQIPQSYIFLS